MKLLFLDIETSPNTAYVWKLFKETIPLARLIDSSEVLCWSAKFAGDKKVMFDSIYQSSPKKMLANIHKLLDECDAVVHYNGRSFDIPILNKEFLIYGFTPPAPYKQIDLINTARSQFRFTSNKLDYICQRLGLGAKPETNFQLWVDCMNKDARAWKLMEKYNKNDVVMLENLYNKLLPWIKGHPNVALYKERTEQRCPRCGGKHYQSRGYIYTATCRYNRYRCSDCGTWFRDRVNNLKTERNTNA
jgi:DNA polymerase elongation subunit (family B)